MEESFKWFCKVMAYLTQTSICWRGGGWRGHTQGSQWGGAYMINVDEIDSGEILTYIIYCICTKECTYTYVHTHKYIMLIWWCKAWRGEGGF